MAINATLFTAKMEATKWALAWESKYSGMFDCVKDEWETMESEFDCLPDEWDNQELYETLVLGVTQAAMDTWKRRNLPLYGALMDKADNEGAISVADARCALSIIVKNYCEQDMAADVAKWARLRITETLYMPEAFDAIMDIIDDCVAAWLTLHEEWEPE